MVLDAGCWMLPSTGSGSGLVVELAETMLDTGYLCVD
jgi:hypothetical protein